MESFNANIIKHKTGLLNLAAELGNISHACRLMGFSRDTFYRYQAARDAGVGLLAMVSAFLRVILYYLEILQFMGGGQHCISLRDAGRPWCK